MFSLILLSLLTLSTANLSGGGFGAHFNWVEWSRAKDLAAQQGKPIMLLFHKSWCSSCARLKPKFASSRSLFEISEAFIMVNAEDDEAPSSEVYYQIDAGYIPKVVFLDSAGRVRPEFSNAAGAGGRYPYYYSRPEEVVETMQRVLREL